MLWETASSKAARTVRRVKEELRRGEELGSSCIGRSTSCSGRFYVGICLWNDVQTKWFDFLSGLFTYFAFVIRDRPWPCFVTLRDPILRKRHKNVDSPFSLAFDSTLDSRSIFYTSHHDDVA
jgi:hypothetical protein